MSMTLKSQVWFIVSELNLNLKAAINGIKNYIIHPIKREFRKFYYQGFLSNSCQHITDALIFVTVRKHAKRSPSSFIMLMFFYRKIGGKINSELTSDKLLSSQFYLPSNSIFPFKHCLGCLEKF